MRPPYTTTQILNCIFYILFLLALAVGIQFFVEWVLNNAMLPALNWFNKLGLTWKLLIFFFGGSIVVYLLGAVVGLVHGVVVAFIFRNLPPNSIVNMISILLFAANTFICIRSVYFIMPSWKLWFILEFILLSIFCFAANYSLLYTANRDKKERDRLMGVRSQFDL